MMSVKQHLVDVTIIEGSIEGCSGGEKKRKQAGFVKGQCINQPEVVLEGQHCLTE